MDHYEGGALVPRIAQDVFQVHDAAFGQTEIVADADGRMDMNRKVKASAFRDQVAKNEVLKNAVLLGSGDAAGNILFVNGLGLLT